MGSILRHAHAGGGGADPSLMAAPGGTRQSGRAGASQATDTTTTPAAEAITTAGADLIAQCDRIVAQAGRDGGSRCPYGESLADPEDNPTSRGFSGRGTDLVVFVIKSCGPVTFTSAAYGQGLHRAIRNRPAICRAAIPPMRIIRAPCGACSERWQK